MNGQAPLLSKISTIVDLSNLLSILISCLITEPFLFSIITCKILRFDPLNISLTIPDTGETKRILGSCLA